MLKRGYIFTFTLIFLFVGIIGRIGYITMSGAYTVADTYHSYSVCVDVNDLQVYYADQTKINNNVLCPRAVVRPVPAEIAYFQQHYNGGDKEQLSKELSRDYPVVIDIIDNADLPYRIFDVYQTVTSLRQLIASSSGGLLKYADESAAEKPSLNVSYLVDAKRRILTGDKGTVQDSAYYSRKGYVLSIDAKVQRAVEIGAEQLDTGCVVVMNPANGKILGCITKPADGYFNKTLGQYSVGSVFKVIVAAAALEKGMNVHYQCRGSIQVGEQTFSCQKQHRHGNVGMKEALAFSCNCYFVHLAQQLGAETLLNMAQQFGFGSDITLFNGWNVTSSVLPRAVDLSSPGALALFSFGQGAFTATPLQICSAMCTVAGGGVYHKPVLVTGEKSINGNLTEYKANEPTRVISKETADTLLSYLQCVVSDGTGIAAQTTDKKAAGKTATAQTGQYQEGREICTTWFSGVYPVDKPRYVITVMCDDGSSGAENCCPVFRTIVENLIS